MARNMYRICIEQKQEENVASQRTIQNKIERKEKQRKEAERKQLYKLDKQNKQDPKKISKNKK